ncbi:hypothetical protein N7448_004900 [Penicillium atrosanguineum]|uniref:Uncharacterized protein n=1 Tax=Penicillium atrosanguineum TaxID=1132637 RepID=A0A9W9PPI6_9EURO|nr:uncharacterized protein N7443_008648 [Penicillium atrosanguineum]KAJ5125580.1 hypothetical protein N7526_007757 [Penicillium atrosanguineum]KAJ5136346.1 hypothetical protein N7448_004900 [Penicillium atrosanguineum]KAJ5292695.1 hypothetical protein N7443_008648 [Penicillium atrosanguineum]KAJ5303280.1 hypothetical protein N7476_010079 [Penicillium atrosanguineum]
MNPMQLINASIYVAVDDSSDGPSCETVFPSLCIEQAFGLRFHDAGLWWDLWSYIAWVEKEALLRFEGELGINDDVKQ